MAVYVGEIRVKCSELDEIERLVKSKVPLDNWPKRLIRILSVMLD